MLSLVCNIFAMPDPIDSVCEARLLSKYRIGSQQYVEFMNYANYVRNIFFTNKFVEWNTSYINIFNNLVLYDSENCDDNDYE